MFKRCLTNGSGKEADKEYEKYAPVLKTDPATGQFLSVRHPLRRL